MWSLECIKFFDLVGHYFPPPFLSVLGETLGILTWGNGDIVLSGNTYMGGRGTLYLRENTHKGEGDTAPPWEYSHGGVLCENTHNLKYPQ